MLFCILIILESIITVHAWKCVSPIRKVYSRTNSNAVLQFTADLTSLPRQFEVRFNDDSIRARITYHADRSSKPEALPGVSIIGDTAGNVVLTLDNVQLDDAGVYILTTAGVSTKCNCLFILGPPVKPTVTKNRTPSVGESVILTCSSTSTTIPSNHSLSLRYNWKVDNIDNPSGTEYTYTSNRNRLTVNNIVKDDANNQFTCTATEGVTDGYTSSSSDQFSFDVYYGPDNVEFTPSDTIYEKIENDSLNQVTCTATCNPECNFKWTKGNTDVSSTAILNLGTLQSKEAGTYRCTATRTGSVSRSKDLTVNVIYGPKSMSFSPSTTTYRLDENSNVPPITCNADCWECSFRWTGPNSFSQSGQVLNLNNLQKSMAGRYTCSATNTKTQQIPGMTKDLMIEVRYGPDLISFTPENTNYIVDEGTTLSNIKCEADCFPSCTYRWTKEGQNTAVSNTDTLPLGTIQKSDDGKYTCRATNGDSTSKYSDSHATIGVRYGPYQSSTKLFPAYEHYTINDGTPLQNINCSADCYPDCSYTWIKTKQGFNTTISTSGILSLGTIHPDDAATYICLATNPTKLVTPTTSKEVTVKVQYGPNAVSINKQSPYYIKEGDTDVVIECSSDCYPGCSYEWTNVTSGSGITTDSKLSIKTVKRFMTSYYKCLSRNSARNYTKSSFATINITVQYAPDVYIKYSSSNIIEGQSLTLFCIGSGIPSVYSYTALTQTWNNAQITNDNREVIGGQKFSSIHFSSLKVEDSGTYTCTLNNGIESRDGKLNKTGSTNLLVEGKPKVLAEELRFTGTAGETAKMQISIYSYPLLESITITRHDGNVLSSNDYNITDHVVQTTFYDTPVSLNGSIIYLMISNLTENDFGNYILELQNIIGDTSAHASIKAKGKPHTPKHFEYLAEYGVPTFQWQKDYNGGLTQTFVIATSIAGANTWTNQINILETDTRFMINNSFYEANITGLSAGIYTARIFANNSEGASDFDHLDGTFAIKAQEEESIKSKEESNTGAIAGGVTTTVIVVIAIVIVVTIVFKRRKSKNKGKDKEREGIDIKSQSSQSQYEDLKGVRETDMSQTYESLHQESRKYPVKKSGACKQGKNKKIEEIDIRNQSSQSQYEDLKGDMESDISQTYDSLHQESEEYPVKKSGACKQGKSRPGVDKTGNIYENLKVK